MPYFLCDAALAVGHSVTLSGDEAHHILCSRRLHPGETLELQNQNGLRFEARVESIYKREVVCSVLAPVPVPPPSPLKLELGVALPKEKTLDWILQKATELGVSGIFLFHGQHSPHKPPAAQRERLLERWQKITLEACKQSGRQFPPSLTWSDSFSVALNTLPACEYQWLLHPSATTSSPKTELLALSLVQVNHCRVWIGPEGGFHEAELALAFKQQLRPLRLGPSILRTETAVLTSLALLQFLWGDIGE